MPSSLRSVALVAGIAAMAAGSVHVSGQQPAADAREQSYLSRATAVLVDVVVRDKQGRPVLDLKADDFEIAEDSVPQEIGSFTLVSRGTGLGIGVRVKKDDPTTVVTPTGTSAAAGEEAPETPAVVAMVFDALSPEGLRLCQRAALANIKMVGETKARMAVFSTEPFIRVIQRYTTDPGLLRLGIEHLSATGTEVKDMRAAKVTELRQRLSDLNARGLNPTQASATIGGGGGGGGTGQNVGMIGQAEVDRRLAQGELRMLQAFESLDRDHRGYATTNSIIAVLESMAFMPGRKSVVFFSEGLPASPVLQTQLQSLIETANRSNITIYAVDANGLRALSSTTETRREVEALADERLRQVASGVDYTDGPLTRGMERTEDLLRYNNEGGLALMAADTGGFLVQGTNDIGAAFRRIDEDMRFHYLLTYAPHNDVMDGKFRTISVKVRRPDVTVFSRRGYRAVRTPAGVPVMTYEAPALAMLDSSPLPNAFASQASAFAFPEADRPGLTPVVVRVTTDRLAFQVDEKKATYNAQAAVVVRVRDAGGQIVQKLSQQYVLTGDAKDLDAAKRGEILFYREPELASGAYQFETIVYDAIAEKASARISTVVVPGPESPRMRMSSLVLVARTEQTPNQSAAKQERTAPFYYGDTLLYPNVGEPLVRGRDEALSFYFVVYPVPGRCACSARIELLKNGQPIAASPSELPTTETKRLQHVGNLSIADLPAGTYELRVTVTDTQDQQTRTAFFTVKERP
jgi:VWFA-related protein